MERGSQRSSWYEPERERAWHLSILAGQGISAWCAHVQEDGAPVAMAWAADDAALRDPLLPLHPVSVSFVSLPEWSTLVPDGALEPGSEARHLALVHGGTPAGAMRDEPIRSLGATCIYVHDDRDERHVLDRFPNARPVPMRVLMVQASARIAGQRPLLLLHRGADRLDVAMHDKGRLLLSNTFPARTAHDLLYFALLAAERTGMQPDAADLCVTGTHLAAGERELLGRYFTHIVPYAPLAWADRSEGAPSPADRWLAVTEQFACVS